MIPSDCQACPRLVHHRQWVVENSPRRKRGARYWARPVPSFGEANPRLLIVGLAPSAHGANRTGRMFTGDLSGEWLFRALYQYGFADRKYTGSPTDGMRLIDTRITCVIHCVPPNNKPKESELGTCRHFLEDEIAVASRLEVVILLGQVAHQNFLNALGHRSPEPRPRFAHGAAFELGNGVLVLDSYHPSQQNTFTGVLTRRAFHTVFRRARKRLGTP